jgi:hypothetical protein
MTATSGDMLSQAGLDEDIDPAKLWAWTAKRARRYASAALLAYWETTPRNSTGQTPPAATEVDLVAEPTPSDDPETEPLKAETQADRVGRIFDRWHAPLIEAVDKMVAEAKEAATTAQSADQAGITIEHTYQGGTIVRGTTRGDGTADPLKAGGARWSPKLSAWYLPQTRDHLPKDWRIDKLARALEDAGFTVTQNVSYDVADFAEAEEGKLARQADRVEALEAKLGRKEAAQTAALDRFGAAMDSLPTRDGQPIHAGRHRRQFNAASKRVDAAGAACQETAKAVEQVGRRLEAAQRTTDRRHHPRAIANRIAKIKAEIRRLERWTPEHQGSPRWRALMADQRNQLAYWERIQGQQAEQALAA